MLLVVIQNGNKKTRHMNSEIYIENLKCGGCAATITKGLQSIDGVQAVSISVEDAKVVLDAEAASLPAVKAKLSSMGYPEVGDKNTVLHKAKSFVSCATGKMNS